MVRILIFLTVLLGAFNDGEAMSLQLKSNAFQLNRAIPSKHTCDGENISPQLSWDGLPEGTKSLALIVDDPDAPSKTWTHWIVFNISPTAKGSEEGKVPQGGVQGVNDFGDQAYGGPCPPRGTHRYFFKLYALDQPLKLSAGASKEQVEQAMKVHVLAEGDLVGTYSRKQ